MTAGLAVGATTYTNVQDALTAVNTTATAGWDISAQGANATNVGVNRATGTSVDLNNADGNVVITKTAASNDVTFDLANDITVDSVTAGNSLLDTTGLTITGGPSVTTTGINAANLAVTNVAPGVAGTDAVNVNQLTTVSTGVDNLGQSVATSLGGTSLYNPVTDTVTAGLAVGATTYTNVQDALTAVNTTATAGWDISAQGANGTTVAPGEAVDLNNGDGNIVVSKTAASDNVTFDLANDITVDSVTAGNSLLDTTGLTITGGPSVTTTGIDAAGCRCQRAAGVNPTDAVNVDQLPRRRRRTTTASTTAARSAATITTTARPEPTRWRRARMQRRRARVRLRSATRRPRLAPPVSGSA